MGDVLVDSNGSISMAGRGEITNLRFADDICDPPPRNES